MTPLFCFFQGCFCPGVGGDTPFLWLKAGKKGGMMTVYVIIGIWSGSIEEVSAWTDSVKANTEVDRLKKKWDIIPGHEAESEHVVYLYELEVQ
jgi:hypothetical protein